MADLGKIAEAACGRVFASLAEFMVAGTYHRGGTSAPVAFLVEPVPARLVDGVTVMPNDERVFIDAADLAGLGNLQPGDYILETTGGFRRNVITAHKDLAGVLWTMVVRRVFT